MKKVVRLTESDLTRMIKRIIEEQFDGEMQASGFDGEMRASGKEVLKSKIDSYKNKMENYLNELKSSGQEIDKLRFLKQIRNQTNQMFHDMFDNSDYTGEGFAELQMDLINYFREKLR